jgi:hypothetical protein
MNASRGSESPHVWGANVESAFAQLVQSENKIASLNFLREGDFALAYCFSDILPSGNLKDCSQRALTPQVNRLRGILSDRIPSSARHFCAEGERVRVKTHVSWREEWEWAPWDSNPRPTD